MVAWGDNADGQLGNGSFSAHTTAQAVHNLANVKQLRGGREHVIALRTNGTVWAWGHNNYGQVGDGTTTNRNVPVQVSGLTDVKQISTGHYHSMALKTNGTVWSWGWNHLGQLGDGTTTNRHVPVPREEPDGRHPDRRRPRPCAGAQVRRHGLGVGRRRVREPRERLRRAAAACPCA